MFSPLRSCLVRSARRRIFIGVISRGVSVENLPRRGFAATCCAYSSVSFGWDIVRDSPMVNIVTQTMNQHNILSWIIHKNTPWSSAAKSMLPGNAKWKLGRVVIDFHAWLLLGSERTLIRSKAFYICSYISLTLLWSWYSRSKAYLVTLAKIQDSPTREVERSHSNCILSFELICQHQKQKVLRHGNRFAARVCRR